MTAPPPTAAAYRIKVDQASLDCDASVLRKVSQRDRNDPGVAISDAGLRGRVLDSQVVSLMPSLERASALRSHASNQYVAFIGDSPERAQAAKTTCNLEHAYLVVQEGFGGVQVGVFGPLSGASSGRK